MRVMVFLVRGVVGGFRSAPLTQGEGVIGGRGGGGAFLVPDRAERVGAPSDCEREGSRERGPGPWQEGGAGEDADGEGEGEGARAERGPRPKRVGPSTWRPPGVLRVGRSPAARGPGGAARGPHCLPDRAGPNPGPPPRPRLGVRHVGDRIGEWRSRTKAKCSRRSRAAHRP